jgi:predicted nucleotidyltransferase
MKDGWRHWKRYEENTTGDQMILNKDFKEFIASLNDNRVRYLVVGGYAVAFHGHPRYTKDMDIWLELTLKNAEQVVKALHQFGFGALELTPEDFLTPSQVIQLGYPPNRIDLLTSLKGVDFESCYQTRTTVSIDGVSVNFIDLTNLKKNKHATGRYQDLADLENLK